MFGRIESAITTKASATRKLTSDATIALPRRAPSSPLIFGCTAPSTPAINATETATAVARSLTTGSSEA